ncbi:MAG: polysaccharide biosynthesis protein [Oscillospiraceae bacterium]|nr:polysaccharide biosynthesis protein [Oscillospiraceae bacterium]
MRKLFFKKRNQSVLIGALILTLSTVVVKILGAFFKIPVGKILGGVGNSYFEAAYALYNPVDALAVAGLPIAISRTVSENVAKGRFKDVRLVHKISIPIFLSTGTVGFFMMIFSAFYYSNLINSPNAIFSTLVLSPTILFSCLMSIYRGYYQGLKNMLPTAISEIIEAASKLVFGLLFSSIIVYFKMDEYRKFSTVFGKFYPSAELAESAILPFAAAGAIAGISVGAVLGFLFLFFRHRKYGDGITQKALILSPEPAKPMQTAKLLIKIALPVGFGALIMNLGGLIDTIIIRRQLCHIMETCSGCLLGIYSSNIPADKIEAKQVHDFLSGCLGYVSSIVMLVPGITQMLGISALPTITEAWALKDREKLRKNIETIIKVTAIISIPSGIGLSVFGESILSLLYGGIRYREVNVASKIIVTMGIATIFTSMSAPICSMLQAIGKINLPLGLLCAGAFIKIVTNYVLVGIPEVNIQGAGIGTLICYGFVFFFSMYFLYRECSIRSNFLTIFLGPLMASILCAILSLYLHKIIEIFLPKNLSIIVIIILFVAVYLSILFALGYIKSKDFMLLKRKFLASCH